MHIIGRGNKSIRWNILNVHWGCRTCHDYLDRSPILKREFFVELIGVENYELLQTAKNWRELTLQEMTDLANLYRGSY
jgi:hypothetical protein